MGNAKLSPPWNEYVCKIEALFQKDPDIKIQFDQESIVLKLFVDSTDKCEALNYFLPSSINFGGQELRISVVPANAEEKDDRKYMKALFKGNPLVHRIEDITIMTSNPMTFIEFNKQIVQYHNDNIGDLHGNRTTVLEEIAREVFDKKDGVFFCTDNGVWNEF